MAHSADVLLENAAMSTRTFPIILVITAIPSTPNIARAETLDAQQKALNLITDTAHKICNDVSTSGEANSSEVKGNVTAQLRDLAAKLADIGVSGTGSITSEQYESVLRSDLAATLKDNAACKLKVFDTLQNKLLGSGAAPAPTTQGAGVSGPSSNQPQVNISGGENVVSVGQIGGITARLLTINPPLQPELRILGKAEMDDPDGSRTVVIKTEGEYCSIGHSGVSMINLRNVRREPNSYSAEIPAPRGRYDVVVQTNSAVPIVLNAMF
jgi:hypothetical protein